VWLSGRTAAMCFRSSVGVGEREEERERGGRDTFVSNEDGEGREILVKGPRGDTIPILEIGEAVSVGDVVTEEHRL
jgi:hypothetical protein